jgi:hypothetical protein
LALFSQMLPPRLEGEAEDNTEDCGQAREEERLEPQQIFRNRHPPAETSVDSQETLLSCCGFSRILFDHTAPAKYTNNVTKTI